MTAADSERRAELIAAAASADALTAADEAELELLRATDPAVDREIDELRRTAARAASLDAWDASPPGDDLRARVLAIASDDAAPAEGAAAATGEDTAPGTDESHPAAVGELRHPSARRGPGRALLALTAAACLVVGAATGGIVVGAAEEAGPIAGPPGTLGAEEPVEFDTGSGVADIRGAVVAHTWGTETMLHVDGLEPRRSYSVVLIGTDGERFESGTFLGSTVSIDCRMNAAVLREDVGAVEIEDATGGVVAEADLPAVS